MEQSLNVWSALPIPVRNTQKRPGSVDPLLHHAVSILEEVTSLWTGGGSPTRRDVRSSNANLSNVTRSAILEM